MSFGFSASDIISLGQLAYRLYNALKSENRPACQELSSALFGLRCALDHLSRQARQNPAISGREIDGVEQIHGDLDKLISSCAETLLQLEGMFAKYSGELKSDDRNPAINITAESTTKRRAMLMSTHTDSINVILNAFIWSASQRIETQGEQSARQLSRIEEQAVRSDEALLNAVREIRASLNEPLQQSRPIRSHASRQMANLQIASDSGQQVALRTQQLEPSAGKSHSLHEQPAGLRMLNLERFTLGNREFQHFGQTHTQLTPGRLRAARRSVATMEKQLTVVELVREIDSIAIGQQNTNQVESSGEADAISAWIRRFEGLVDKWRANSTKHHVEEKTRREGMQTLLLSLNRVMAAREDGNRRLWYRVMLDRGIERIFDKLRALLRSVTVEKEIQTF
ncbi:MAG: hypothetical protein Q9191_004235 [Dirinaria sp. TL-2023a]